MTRLSRQSQGTATSIMSWRKLLNASALLVTAMLAACGGGEDGPVRETSGGYTVDEGVAQKGPLLRGSLVSVNELNPLTFQPAGTSFNFEIADDYGTFKPAATLFTKQYLESTALGYFFDELTGKPSTDVVILRALTDLSVDRAVNINLLTDVTTARIRSMVARPTNPFAFGVARSASEREALAAFSIYNSADLMPGGLAQPKNFTELDLSKNRSADQALAAISAVVTQIGKSGSGINQFINQFESDLADDGRFNNSPGFAVSVVSQINTAAKVVDWTKLAANLNTFYRTNRYLANDLRQWIDTSGGVDRVIDRYKFSASNVVVGTESLSPEYVAGADDAGQCVSVSAGKLYRNGATVTGTIKAVKGDKFRASVTSNVAGSIVNTFIQRSTPTGGVCPSTVPASGLTRIAKWTTAYANQAPIADAGLGQTVTIGALVQLNGGASSDADGDALKFAWVFASKPVGSNATLSGPTTATPTFVADVAGTYVAAMAVNDGKVNSNIATVTITAVSADAGPSANTYNIAVTRVESNFYSISGSTTIIQTKYCYEYALSQPAVLVMTGYSGYGDGYLHFSNGGSCEVAGAYSPMTLIAGPYSARLTVEAVPFYSDLVQSVIVRATTTCFKYKYSDLASVYLTYTGGVAYNYGMKIGSIVFSDSTSCDLAGIYKLRKLN